MPDDPAARRRVALSIVQEATRGDGSNPIDELNPFDALFFRNPRVALYIPILDPVETRQCLVFLRDEIGHLIIGMDSLKDRRSKSLLAVGKLKTWNHAFARRRKKQK